jgi:hypothetical protein
MPPVEEIMTEMHQHLDEGTIHAWLDGALAPDESARVEAQARTCVACGALVAEARGLVAASSRILASLDVVPAGVIPGSDRGADQLAALRARRNATTRRWWHDPRVVAAASLVFIAGTFSVVWRASTDRSDLAQVPPAAPGVVVDATSPAANAPAAGPGPAAVAESREPDMKSAARERDTKSATRPSPGNAPPPSRVVVTGVATEATSSQKMEQVAAPDSLKASVAANEAKRVDVGVGAVRQAVDSPSTVAGANRARSADAAARQQAALTPQLAGQQQAQLTFERRVDTVRAAAPSPVVSRRMASAAVGSAGGFRLSDAVLAAGVCYELRVIRTEGGQPSAVADTVRLLEELSPERSDPSWRRAQRLNASLPPAVLTWREIDSARVELRIFSAVDSTIVRFGSANIVIAGRRGVIVRPAERPDVRSLPGVRAAFALKIDCP